MAKTQGKKPRHKKDQKIKSEWATMEDGETNTATLKKQIVTIQEMLIKKFGKKFDVRCGKIGNHNQFFYIVRKKITDEFYPHKKYRLGWSFNGAKVHINTLMVIAPKDLVEVK